MLPESIQLIVVTPERQLLRESVVEVTIPGLDGELGILPGHAPLITELGIGELSYKTSASSQSVVLRYSGIRRSSAGPRHCAGGNRRARRRNRPGPRRSGQGSSRTTPGVP